MSDLVASALHQRYKITIEYAGTGYAGWQRQPGLKTIQGQIEKAIYQYCQQETYVYCSGRTDAGVHALRQVAHFDLDEGSLKEKREKGCRSYQILRALNYYLTDDSIRILKAEKSPPDFHARFSAKKRSYIYKIISRVSPLALDKNRAWYIYKPLDLKAMQEGAMYLIGRHDFTSFRASACQSKSPIKTLNKIDITQEGDVFSLHVEAPSFLHHQVRNIVGTLKLVGEGRWTPNDVKIALDLKNRTKSGPTADASGLYFEDVYY